MTCHRAEAPDSVFVKRREGEKMTTKADEQLPIEDFFKMMKGFPFECIRNPEKYVAELADKTHHDSLNKETSSHTNAQPHKRG
jgi:hypothetical protein